MSKTISNSISTGVTLTSAYDPLFITSSGEIVTSARAAIYGNASQAWQIYNAGLVDGLGSFGIDLLSGSTVTNTGMIEATQGNADAVRIDNGAGRVVNHGRMTGGFDGIALTAGGSVANSGTIVGTADAGIAISGGVGTVANYGTIGGGTDAVIFSGAFADRVIMGAGAVFQGVVKGGTGTNTLELAAGTSGATGTLSGIGTSFTNFGTIAVDSGAKWEVDGALNGTLENTGLIVSTVTIAGGGSVLNSGTINAGSASYGITLSAGGTVNNIHGGALTEGARYGIRAAGAAAVITNEGTILGTAGADGGGVGLYDGGTVTNTGTIIGSGGFGVYLDGGGTVANYGTIEGIGAAVDFKGGSANRLIISPAAVFAGSIAGGASNSTLELAAGSAGAVGTLSNFASEFKSFFGVHESIQVDTGADWTFDATDTLSFPAFFQGFAVITVDGTLNSAANILHGLVTVTNGGSFGNTGTINGVGHDAVYIINGGSVSNTGLIRSGFSVQGSGALTNSGTIQSYFFEHGGSGTLTNSGTMTVPLGLGVVDMTAGGTINNKGLLTETGGQGSDDYAVIRIGGGIGDVTNSGSVVSSYDGIVLSGGDTVTNTGTISGKRGIYISGGAGTVTNAGTIIGTQNAVAFGGTYADRLIVDPGAVFVGTVAGGSGTNTLELAAGTSGATGTLSGIGTSFTNFGTLIVDAGADWQIGGAIGTTITVGAGGTVHNVGTVAPGSSAAYGVWLQGGGGVSNSGTITAPFTAKGQAVRINGGAGTVNNTGLILGAGDGVVLTGGGNLVNSGSIGGTSKIGVYVGGAAGTVTNSGTISGGAYAVEFHGSGTPGGFADRLIIDPGAVFQGKVQGRGADSTIELAAGTAGATGTLSAFGASFTNFGSIVIDSGAKWALDGASPSGQQVTLAGTGDLLALGTPGSFADAIVGFGLSDKLDLTGLAYSTGATATLSGSTLTVTSGSTTDTFTLDGVAAGTKFEAVDDGTPSHGTLVKVACYCRGTRILTDHGEVPVEDLAVGDRVITASGAARPVKWIGQRSYAGWLAAGNAKVWPICLAPGSLADGVPARALRVSPEHAIWLDGALVPAGLLVNGCSIVKSAPLDEVHYYHVELDAHDIILAEGAAAESFADDGSRGMFHNAAEFHARYPDERRAPATFCAPRLVDGFALDALQQRLAARGRRLRPDGVAAPARLRGYVERVTREGVLGWAFDPEAPDTRVVVAVFDNGVAIGRAVADLPRGDLARAGIGDGRHGFFFTVPGGFGAGVRHEIAVRGADGACLAAHAGVVLETQAAPQAAAALGRLVGRLDQADRRRVTGWAQDSADPERRVGLVVTANGAPAGRVLANLYRGDLEAAARGSGRHSFAFALPACLASDETVQIRVLREADGAELPGSPFDLPAVSEAGEADALKRLVDETQALLARRAARAGGARDSACLRALVIDLQTPDPTRDGGSAAILSHMRALTSLGYAVGFAPADGRMTPEAADFLSNEGMQAYAAPYYAGVEDVLRKHARAFDVIYLHRHDCADRYLALARAHHPKARIVYSVADLHHVRLARQAQAQGRPELLAYSRRVAALEAHAAARADLVLTHSPAEAQVLRQVAGFGRVQVVPFAAATRPGRRGFAERHGLAFIGSFHHAPNADAVYGLARDIMPLVWAQDPSITCRIAGHGWHAGRLPDLDPRVEILGQIDDLDGLLDKVRLTVAPLRFGAGIKAKVLDSFGAGVPCVMTAIAAEGLPLGGPTSHPVADDAAALAGHILRLHADQALNERTGAAARRLVADGFSQARVTDALGKALLAPSAVQRCRTITG